MASHTALLDTTASPASVAPRPLSPSLSRILGWAVYALLCAVLADVLLEGWIQQVAGHWSHTPAGSEVYVLADWPKTLKNGLYLVLAGVAVLKVAVDRRWRDFLSKADLALAALGAVMVLAGLVGGSHLPLIGEALFVYFRGVIVFVAWRALNPSWRMVRPVLYGLGAFAVVNALLATMQTLLGYPSYRWLGWTDLTWAKINRAHALFNHPNHLGHFLALALLGLLAWFATREGVGRRWWVLFGLLAFGLSATQSRESTVGFLLGAVVIWVLRRGRVRAVALGVVLVLLCAGLQLAVSPHNRAVLMARLQGVAAALHVASGDEPIDACIEGDPLCTPDRAVPKREIRVLFAQQGVRLWVKEPLLGYGVGQFGGIVAFKDNPGWAGKLGFDLHGAKPDQVDSFWLHLLVETGLLGVLAYFLWLFFLVAPMVRARTRGPGVHPFVLWGPAVLAFSVFTALLSPALEDPLYPPLMFTALGLAWVVLRRGETADAVPATGIAGPAERAVALPESEVALPESETDTPATVDGK